jgi:3-oxoadipate enol-lactonase
VVLPSDDVGTGEAVVLLHAGIADRRMWSEQISPIADAGYRVVAMDLPGFGEAPASSEGGPWSDVLETMDSLDIDRTAVVGSSFGGAVALNVAVIAPERVSALALASAPPPDLEPSSTLLAAWEAEESALERGDIEGAVDAVVEAWLLPGASETLRDRVASMQRRAFEHQATAAPDTGVPAPAEEDPGALERLDLPALVMAGELDLPDFRLGAERLAQQLPDARHMVIPGAGHLAPLEEPEEFRQQLMAFLADIRPARA